MTQEQFLTPLNISDEDAIYRQTHFGHIVYTENSKNGYPKPSHFKPHGDGLSVHWAQHIKVDGVYHIISLSHKNGKKEYKNPKDFKVFTLPVKFIRSIEGITSIDHTPVFNGNPAPVGNPNNYAHTSLVFADDEQIRLELSDYCRNNNGSFCNVDFELLESEIEKLRLRLDNTPYHRLDYIGAADNSALVV